MGGEVIQTLLLEGIVAVLVIVMLVIIRLPIVSKIILFVVYGVALYVTNWYIGDIPYMQNQVKINLIVTVVPLLATLFMYLILKLLSVITDRPK